MATFRYDTSGKHPVWRVRIRIAGHPTVSESFPTRTEAEAYALQTEKALRSKPRPTAVVASTEVRPKVPTLTNILKRYRREILPTKRPNTIIARTQQLAWWEHRLGRLALDEISPKMIAEAKSELVGKEYKGTTVNRYLSAISHVFIVSMKDWFIEVDNPVSKIRRMPEGNGKTRYLTDEERPRLLQACRESVNPMLYSIVMVALSTGMRRNEILTLRWKSVDLHHECIRLADSKNHEPRVIPLTGEALTLLKALRDTRCDETPDMLVFKAPKGAQIYAMESAWQKALRIAGIEGFCFHSLRHTVGSYLAMQGCTQLDIARVLGHKKIATTQRYTHLSTSHIRGILEHMTSTL